MNAKKALIAALSALALPALAHAAAKPAARDLPDWNGIWERVGSITWEPNGRPGVPENPPFTPEYAEKYRKTTEAAREGHPVQDPTSTCLPPMPISFSRVIRHRRLPLLSRSSQTPKISASSAGSTSASFIGSSGGKS